jgi:CubicO group peptidase (beta-lactamase class C family)
MIRPLTAERNHRVGNRRSRQGLAAALFVAGALFLLPLADASLSAADFSDVQTARIAAAGESAARAAMEKRNSSAVSVALADTRGIIWEGNFGLLERENPAPVTGDSMYGLCSVSKMVTTAAVMKLVDRGIVDLDAPFMRYVPDFRMADPRYRDITVRMLLNHSAGLPGQTLFGGFTGEAPYEDYPENVLKAQAVQRLKHEPGYAVIYTNDGFSLLEVLIRRVTGLSFAEFVQRDIFNPLRMERSRMMTSLFAQGSFARPDLVDDYSPADFINLRGTGGVFMSIRDFAHFAGSFLAEGRLLSAASLTAMAQDQTEGTASPLESDAFRFGLGWDSVRQPSFASLGITGWQKGGDLGFYGATMIVLPEEGLAAVVTGATNFNSGTANDIAEEVLLAALVEKGRIPRIPEKLPLAAAIAEAPDLRERAQAAGFYVSMPFTLYKASFDRQGTLDIMADAGGEWVQVHAGLTKRVDGWYSKDGYPVSVRFVSSDGRKFFAIRYPYGRGIAVNTLPMAQKLDAAAEPGEAWKQRLGHPWLLSSDIPEAIDLVSGHVPTITPKIHPLVAGYLSVDGNDGTQLVMPVSDDTAAMFLVTPPAMGRDTKDLVATQLDGTDYLRLGAELYRNSRTVPALSQGTSDILQGTETAAASAGEWRRLPAAGTLHIAGAALWRVYDDAFSPVSSGRTDGSASWSGEKEHWLVVYLAGQEPVHVELAQSAVTAAAK